MHKIDAPGATENNRFTEGDPAAGIPATEVSAAWLNAVQAELVKVIESAGLTLKDSEGETGDQLLSALQAMGLGGGQFQDYSSARVYETGEVARGSDGHFYEFYDCDQTGTVQGIDPTDSANRPHVWMEWDGVRPATVIEWRSETLPEGYIANDGSDYNRTDYRRIFAAWGTTHGEGDGSTTFGSPDDRGEFKRGWDNGRGIDAGRSISSNQKGSLLLFDNINGNITVDVGRGTLSSLGLDVASGSNYLGTNRSFVNETNGASEDAIAPDNYGTIRPRNNAAIWLTKI